MDTKILIKNLTWFNLVEKLKVILNKLVASAFIDAPSDGNQYVRQDGAWEEFSPTLQQVTENGNTTDQVLVSSNNISILSSLVRVIQNIDVVNTTGVRLFNTGSIQLQTSPSSGVTIYATNTTTNRTLQAPDENGTLVIDAPADGIQYARKDGAWEEVASGGSSGKQLKALIGTTSSGGNITVYNPLVNSIGLLTPVWTRVAPGIYTVTFANTATVFTGTLFTTVGGNTSTNDTRIISTYKIGNTFYITCRTTIDGSNVDLTPNDTYALFIESL